MELWITRHGETQANVDGILQGHQGGDLTNKGFEQAKLIGKRLSSVCFKEIYISDLNRTIQTSKEIICYHKNSQIYLEKRLREKSGGILEGKSMSYVKELIIKKNIPFRKFRPINGENWNDVNIRVKEFLQELINKHVRNKYPTDVIFQKDIQIEENNTEIFKNIDYIYINKKETDNNIIDPCDDMAQLSLDEKFIPYKGYKNDTEINRILIITHGGVIMELNNIIYNNKGLENMAKNNTFNCGLYVVKVYCMNCGLFCINGKDCKLEYDYVLFNDNAHCKD